MKDDERKQKEAEAKAAEEKRLAEEKAKAEAEAAAKAKAEADAAARAEAEAKKGYDTGITYDQLARTPDDFITQKVKFRGKVVQVMEGDGTTQIRLAVNENYDTILFAEFDSSVVSSRVLEDDIITIMGLSSGLITYESTMGGQISIPGVLVDKIEQ
jgi:phage-related protein